ncbi:hypothetical protein H0H81_000347 [Sphagnurus paluster]|uniref:Uncharacterized protein n=1 Tax=Sphagnurus paluster TaxID=117069 RepID=A0A9P7FMZ4_9AGAR|nr:hypothetical protein H0H81_000347 [Sphagnurus paluster]
MSSQEAHHDALVPGKVEIPISTLVAALKHYGVNTHEVFGATEAESSAVATDAELEKFWVAIKKVNVQPSSLLLENTEGVQPAGAATVIAAIALAITIAQTLWNIFRSWDDKDGRSQWTQDLVRQSFQRNPQFNYVVVHTRHSINFNGVRDVDWSVERYNYSLRIGSVPYDLYVFRSGTFSLLGDGGFLNWAFTGRVVSQDPDSRRPRNVVFSDV